MRVIRHNDERMEFVRPLLAIMLDRFEEDVSAVRNLEQASPVVGNGRDEEGAFRSGSLRDSHGARSIGPGRTVVAAPAAQRTPKGLPSAERCALSARASYGTRKR